MRIDKWEGCNPHAMEHFEADVRANEARRIAREFVKERLAKMLLTEILELSTAIRMQPDHALNLLFGTKEEMKK